MEKKDLSLDNTEFYLNTTNFELAASFFLSNKVNITNFYSEHELYFRLVIS